MSDVASDGTSGMDEPAGAGDRRSWEAHWQSLSSSRRLFAATASLVRRTVLSRAVRHFCGRYFPARGWFVEAGCGTGESAARIRKGERRLVGLDFSLTVLAAARRQASYDHLVCADLRQLPFRDAALAGVWNLGVMEHFPEAAGVRILAELRRVLAEQGVVILFWPPVYGLSRFLLAPLEWWQSRRLRRVFRFFPDEVNRLQSPAHARRMLTQASLHPVTVRLSLREGFNQLVVVARRTPQ